MRHRPLPASASAASAPQRIDRIYDHLYANAPVRTPRAIAGEVGKVLRTAAFVEEEAGPPAFRFARAELQRLAAGDAALSASVAARVRGQFSRMNRSLELYEAGAGIELDDRNLAFVCAELDGIALSDPGRDVCGDAVEIFRGQWQKRSGGQFFTDQRVTHLAVALLRFEPLEGDDFVDPCAGTGGFLLAALERIKKRLGDGAKPPRAAELAELAARRLAGAEIDPDVCEVANATLATRVGRLPHPLVERADALAEGAFTGRSRRIAEGTHACVASNPPFGTRTTIKDARVLGRFALARRSSRPAPRSPDVLLLEQDLRLLRPGSGRLAIVLPYQLVSGPQARFVREWLLRNAQILAAVDLPRETFLPHTGTKGCLVVARRRREPLDALDLGADPPVFFALARHIGHDRRGRPVYRRDEEGAAGGEILSDFEDVERAFEAHLAGEPARAAHEGSFTAPASAIGADAELRLNALYHRPAASARGPRARGAQPTTRLREATSRIFFPARFKRRYVERGAAAVPFLGGANISQLVVVADKWLAADDPKLAELRVEEGWILVTRSGSTGIVSSVPRAWHGFAMSEHVIRIVPDERKLPGPYVQAFLRTRLAQEAISRGVFGSVIDEITPELIGELEIPLPSASVLKEIAALVREAEIARQAATRGIAEAVARLDALFTPETRP